MAKNIDYIDKLSALFLKVASNYTSIKKTATRDFVIVPAGTPLYHGSSEPQASKIESDGFLRSDVWSVADAKGKVSSGTLDEEGLIWFSSDKEDAEEYARGEEAKRKRRMSGVDVDILPGKIFIYKPNKNLKLVNRYASLTKRDAEILQAINPRPYDPIMAGMSLNLAAYKMIQHTTDYKTLKDIFKLLKFDGMIYEGKHYAIMADRLPISESYSIEDIAETKEPKTEEQTTIINKDNESFKLSPDANLDKINKIDKDIKDILELMNKINKKKYL